VETWNKQFQNSERVQRVPLLYLANDIIQNSRCKGNEFVTEFWAILPTALKDALEKGDDQEKYAVSRLVSLFPGSKTSTSEYNHSNHCLEMWEKGLLDGLGFVYEVVADLFVHTRTDTYGI